MTMPSRKGATQRRRQIERLPDVLAALARSLRGGNTLHTAFVGLAADRSIAGPGLQRAGARVDGGSPIRDEIDRWAESLGHRDADLVRAVLSAGSLTGTALAASLDRAATSLQERADLRREIAALTAQARASAFLLTVAPVGFLAVLIVADASVLGSIFATQTGRVAFGVGVVLDVLGWFWMRQLAVAVDR